MSSKADVSYWAPILAKFPGFHYMGHEKAALNLCGSPRPLVDFQEYLFENYISFNYMTSNDPHTESAACDFSTFVGSDLPMHGALRTRLYGLDGWFARFITCRMQGESTEHAPVLFLEGHRKLYDPSALDESFCIPAPANGVPRLFVFVLKTGAWGL